MSVSGLCAICEAAPAVDTCARCGTMVCERHFDRAHGLCSECAAQASPE